LLLLLHAFCDELKKMRDELSSPEPKSAGRKTIFWAYPLDYYGKLHHIYGIA